MSVSAYVCLDVSIARAVLRIPRQSSEKLLLSKAFCAPLSQQRALFLSVFINFFSKLFRSIFLILCISLSIYLHRCASLSSFFSLSFSLPFCVYIYLKDMLAMAELDVWSMSGELFPYGPTTKAAILWNCWTTIFF